MKRHAALLVISLFPIVALMASCADPDQYGVPVVTSERVSLSSGFAQYRLDAERVDFVRVTEDGLSSRSLFTPLEEEYFVEMYAGPADSNPDLLFVVTLPRSQRQETTGPGLTVIDPSADDIRRYNTASYFGNVKFSPDERYGILYHSSDDANYSSGLYNPNEVSLLNLTAPPSGDNPATHSMDLSGDVLSDILFLGVVNIEGASRNLAAFITDGRIKLVDIEDPDFDSVTVKLKTDEDPRTILVSKIISRPPRGDRPTTLFAMAPGISEIFEIPLVATPDGFTAPSLNQQDGGPNPSDMIVVNDDSEELLVVVNGGAYQVNVVSVDSGEVHEVALLDGPSRIMSRTSGGKEELVLHGSNLWSLYFCDVSRLEEEPEKAFEEFPVPEGVSDSRPLDNNRMTLFPQGMYGLMILELEDRALTYLSSNSDYDWRDSRLVGDIYYLPQADGLAWLDLNTGHPDLLVFDEPMTELQIFPDTGLGVAMHATITGRATLFPLDRPIRDAAFVSDGYGVEGIMNSEVAQ